uniref:Uncharacterized protein n=1 Tax=Salix viminalis TaxID=40686 RepID=A0A6N2K4P9_SALVM
MWSPPSDAGNVCGPTEIMKITFCALCSWFLMSGAMVVKGNEKAWCKGEPQDVGIKEDCDGFTRMFCIQCIEESFGSVDKSEGTRIHGLTEV